MPPLIKISTQKLIHLLTKYIKNHLLTKDIKLKDVTLKNEVQIKYKQYRNLLFTLMKENKNLISKIISKTT